MRFAAIAACIALAIAAPRAQDAERSPGALMDALMWGKEPVGAPFALVDHEGRPRTDRDFLGKIVLLYFGYTHCPDACPTDVLAITLALKELGARGGDVQPLFVTLDPERDTKELMADYLGSFDPRWIGLTGEIAEIRKLALAYKVWFAKAAPTRAGDYAIDHTSYIFIVGRDGKYVGFLPTGTEAGRIAAAVKAATR